MIGPLIEIAHFYLTQGGVDLAAACCRQAQMIFRRHEELLTPSNIKHLQPMLAQHLYWYNLKITSPTYLPSFTPEFLPWPWLLIPTGNWLLIPVWTRQGIEEDICNLYTIHQKALILAADAFAALLGQGPALERQLRETQRAMRLFFLDTL